MHARHQVGQLIAGEVGGCATAEVQLSELARTIEQFALHGNLALEVFEVLDGALGLVGDDLVAGAVIAKALAERNRSEEHTSELQSLMRISYAVFCLKKKKKSQNSTITEHL